MFNVLVTDHGFQNFDIERKILHKADAKLTICRRSTAKEVVDAAQDADAIMTSDFRFTEQVIRRLKRCRVIVRYGVGFDTIDLNAATRHNVMVVNVPDYCVDEVSEHAVTFVLALNRLIFPYYAAVKERKNLLIDNTRPVRALRDSVAGIIGYGRIGKATAEKLAALGLAVIFFDPYVGQSPGSGIPFEQVSRHELFNRSDFIILHAPSNAETFHLIDAESCASMSKRPFLVNVSRGELVNSGSLCDALDEGKISGAGLDVLEKSTDQNTFDRLLAHPNVIVTPHSAWYSDASVARLKRMAAEEVVRVLLNQMPMSLVNPAILSS